MMIGQTLWIEFFSNRDWPVASAVAVVLLGLLVVPIVVYQHRQMRQLEGGAVEDGTVEDGTLAGGA